MFARFRFLLVLLLGFSFSVHSQSTSPKTLLWRISGNGLSKPSYVYGTIHLQHKRLFYFPDSLYRVMDATEGLATEIDFREYMDSLVRAGFEEAESEHLKEIKVHLDKKKISRSADSLLKKYGLQSDKITKADLKMIRDKRMQQWLKEGEMPSIMDGYLYGLAVRQKKWVGGIEDLADQNDAFDDINADLTPESVLADEKVIKDMLYWMMNTYERADLDSIDWMSKAGDPDYRDVVLIRRNIKMARRMDSLSAIRSMLFLVGAAHLPGDSGVLTLLRNRGFTVEPVFSSSKKFIDSYARNLPAAEWQTFTDPKATYSVQMPHTPSSFNMLGETVPLFLCVDVSTFHFYFTGQTIGRYSSYAELEKACAGLYEKMSNNRKGAKIKNISTGDFMGAETLINSEEALFRVRMINKNNVLYLLFLGGMKESSMYSAEADRFFLHLSHMQLMWQRKLVFHLRYRDIFSGCRCHLCQLKTNYSTGMIRFQIFSFSITI